MARNADDSLVRRQPWYRRSSLDHGPHSRWLVVSPRRDPNPRRGRLHKITSDARVMAFHAETSELSATAVELRALSALGLARVARLFNVDLRSARRWRDGTRQL